jgi:hypothetical protein
MIFTNFKTSSPRKINSQIIEIFNYLNISPIIIKVSQYNDLEDFFIHENVPGLNSISDELDSRLDIFMKLFIMLYEDDTVLMAESSNNLIHMTIYIIQKHLIP